MTQSNFVHWVNVGPLHIQPPTNPPSQHWQVIMKSVSLLILGQCWVNFGRDIRVFPGPNSGNFVHRGNIRLSGTTGTFSHL